MIARLVGFPWPRKPAGLGQQSGCQVSAVKWGNAWLG